MAHRAKCYVGIDVVKESLGVAQERWGKLDAGVGFFEVDVFSEGTPLPACEVVVALGVAAFADEGYLLRLMKRCYALATKAAVISVTSLFSPGPKEDVLTYTPGALAQTVSSFVTKKFTLRCDYLPTDLMVYLYK